MYLIALCDDEAAEMEKIKSLLEQYREWHSDYSFQIDCFVNVNELLIRMEESGYMPDILFMDIYMPEKMGIQAAQEIREMGNGCRIIFLTSSKEYALEAYRVDAVQYLLKPISDKELFPVLDKTLKAMEREQQKHLLLRIDGTIRRVALHDILYCEAQKKSQRICLTENRQLQLRMTMGRLQEMLAGHDEFVRVGVAYIINLEHVESLNTQMLQMDNGDEIYLPRGSYQNLRELYFDYYCGNDD